MSHCHRPAAGRHRWRLATAGVQREQLSIAHAALQVEAPANLCREGKDW